MRFRVSGGPVVRADRRGGILKLACEAADKIRGGKAFHELDREITERVGARLKFVSFAHAAGQAGEMPRRTAAECLDVPEISNDQMPNAEINDQISNLQI